MATSKLTLEMTCAKLTPRNPLHRRQRGDDDPHSVLAI
jgi:hypothetical protein